MIRRTVIATPVNAGTRGVGFPAFPVGFWPQSSAAALPSRWTVGALPKTPAQLPVDVFTTENEAVVRAALPGVDPEHIEISAHQDTVTISAQLPDTKTVEADNITWLVAELGCGAFQRTIRLPFQIQEEQVEAQFANGLLQIVLPKHEAEKPHRISVQVRQDLKYELGAGESEKGTFAAD